MPKANSPKKVKSPQKKIVVNQPNKIPDSDLLSQNNKMADDDAKSDKSNKLNHIINDLTKEVKNAEYRAEMAEKESESRKDTITKLKEINTKSLDDLNNANSQLSLRNQSINTLKETIKDLQKQLQDSQSEKTSIKLAHNNSEDVLQSKNKEIEQLKHDLQASMEDLLKHPSFIALQSENNKLKKDIEIEKEGRIAALSAWQKMEKKIKDTDVKYAEKESQYLRDCKELRMKFDETQQKLSWAEQKLEASRDSTKTLDSDYKMLQEENLNLKIRINSMESEIRSQAQIEGMKSKAIIENAMTEMKWREHLLIQQLEKFKSDLNKEQVQRLKYQKAVRTMEVEMANSNNQNINNSGPDPKQKALVKRRYTELDDIDAEIHKLRKEIKYEQSNGPRPDRWIRNPPAPQLPYFQQSMMNQQPVMNQYRPSGLPGIHAQPKVNPTQSMAPTVMNTPAQNPQIHKGSRYSQGQFMSPQPTQNIQNRNSLQPPQNPTRRSSYNSALGNNGNRISGMPRRSSRQSLIKAMNSQQQLLSPDAFWNDLPMQDPPAMNLGGHGDVNSGYDTNQRQRRGSRKRASSNINGYSGSDKPVRASRISRRKTRSDTSEKPRWR